MPNTPNPIPNTLNPTPNTPNPIPHHPFKNYIAGEWVSAEATFENRNPANWDEVVGVFPLSTREDVDRAARAAAEAYKMWRLIPAPARGEVLRRTGEIMLRKKEELAQLMTRE